MDCRGSGAPRPNCEKADSLAVRTKGRFVGDWRPSLAICLPEGERSRGLRGCGKGRFVALFGVRLVVAGLGVVFVQIVCCCLAWRWAGLEEGPLYGLV